MTSIDRSSLSGRARQAGAGGLPEYYRVHAERQGTEGYTGLCVAEDHQVRDLVLERLSQVPPAPPEVLGYDAFGGRAGLKAAVAGLVGREVFGRNVDPDHVKVLSGAGAVLEALAFALGDPGDVVLVPTPSYAGFWPDLEGRAGLRIHPVHTRAEDGFALTTDLLDAAVGDAPGRVRAVLLTNPDNPRGEVVPPSTVRSVLDWAATRDLHVIADEVYALSVHGSPFDGEPFASVGRLLPSLGDRVHVVWAVSKDLAASGLRTGFLLSEHQPLLDAVEVQGTWSGVSGLVQHALADVLGDRAWLSSYVPAMRRGLRESAQVVRDALDGAGIPRTSGDAGFFLLADLRAALDQPTWEAEHRLWQRIVDEGGVNLTPGSALRSVEPGWFRICHASNPLDAVADAMGRVVDVL
jgi:aspartate/methionine/tyrosine aminotransferase